MAYVNIIANISTYKVYGRDITLLKKNNVPLISNCYTYLECKVLHTQSMQFQKIRKGKNSLI